MAVASAPFYWLLCDGCGVSSTEGNEHVAWISEDQAAMQAEESGWHIGSVESHHCWKCTKIDEDD